MPTKYGYTKAGYTALGYTSEDYDSYWNEVNLRPWKPKIEIFDHQDNKLLLHTYNSFSDQNELSLAQCSTGESLGTAGGFQLVLQDNKREIDRTKVGNACKVVISIARNSYGPWKRISSGYIEHPRILRDKYNGLNYQLGGYGSAILVQELITNFKKTATRISLGSAEPDPNDHTMQVKNLMKYLLTSADHLVASDQSVVEKGNFTLNISDDLDIFVPSISIQDHPVATGMNFLSDRSGALWGGNADDQIWAWYPQNVHSGITLKTFKPEEKYTDPVFGPCYFFGNWDYSYPIDTDSFGNVLIAYAGTPSRAGSASTTVGSTTGTGGGGNATGTPLGSTEVIQQIPVTIPQISKISVLLQKIGPLRSKFANGIIYSDIPGQNRPNLSNIMATFQLDISRLVTGVPTAVFSTQMSKVATAPIGSKAWLSLQYVGPRNDAETVSWLHSGTANKGSSGEDLYYGTRAVAASTSSPITGEGQAPFTLANDRIYTFATFYDTKTKVVVKDPRSIQRYGEVERVIDIPWTTDFKTINDLLFLMLNTTSKPPMIYNVEKISIPEGPIQVGKLISVQDDISGLGSGTFTQALITSLGYDFNAYSQDSAVGTYFCDIGISGIYDWLTYEHADIIENLSCSPPLTEL